MQQLKLKPIIITFVIMIIVLVTSGFAYQYMSQQKPLTDALQQLKYATLSTPIKQENEQIYVEIKPNADVNLDVAVQEVYSALNAYNYGNANIHVSLSQSTEPMLDELWKQQLFEVAEAMASQNYSQIPELMMSLEQQDAALHANAAIDNQYVYVTLKKEQEVKHILLPLHTEQLEVWKHE